LEQKFIGLTLTEEGAASREIPCDFYLKAPYTADLEENYRVYGELDK
jgi:hypothetical protein